ncbi:MAG: hypothetical protein ABSE43_01065, partial [Steroidobacteraceae bacterium]
SSSVWACVWTQFSPRRTLEVNFCCLSSVIMILDSKVDRKKAWLPTERPRSALETADYAIVPCEAQAQYRKTALRSGCSTEISGGGGADTF